MSKIQKKVKIGIVDPVENNIIELKEIQQWIKNYNIQYYDSYNSSCLNYFNKAKYLKVIIFKEYPRCVEEELNVLLQLKTLHTLNIQFKPGTK